MTSFNTFIVSKFINYYVMFVCRYNIGFSIITYVIPVCIIFIAHFQICRKLRARQEAFESKSINSVKKEIRRNSQFNDVLTREPPPNNSNKNAADSNGSYMIIARHAKDINGLRLSNIVISKRKVSL